MTLFLEEAGDLLGAATFVLFGAVMLVPVLDDLTAGIVVYSVLSLTIVRMLPVALAMLGSGARRPTLAFLGWFGPRGLASIVFAVILVEEADLEHAPVLLTTIFFTVGLSVLLHGLSATPSRPATPRGSHRTRRSGARVRERADSRAAPTPLGAARIGSRTPATLRPSRAS